MAKRLNKRTVVFLTIAGMAVITVAGVVMTMGLPEKDPKPLIEKAKQFEEKGEYENALKHYQRAWAYSRSDGEDSPESNALLITMGDTALKIGRADMALNAWGQILLNDRRNEKAQEKIVELHLEMASLSRSGGIWRTVQEEAEKLCAINEKNFIGLHALGEAMVMQRGVNEEYEAQGGEKLEAAFEGDKSNPEFAKSLADHYLRQSVQDEALIAKAVDVFDTLIRALKEQGTADTKALSTAWRYRGNYYLGRKALSERDLNAEQGGRASSTRISELQQEIAKADAEAFSCFQKAVEAAPDDVESLLGLGRYWEQKKSTASDPNKKVEEDNSFRDKAIEHYEKAIHTNPATYAAYLQLANLYSRQGEYENTWKVLDQRLQRASQRAGYLAWRNRIYISAIRSQAFRANMALIEAVDGDTKAQPKEKEEKHAIFLNRLQEIYRDFCANARAGDKDPMAQFMKARIFILQNKPYEAIRLLTEADSVASNASLEIKFYRAHLLRRTRQPGEAEKVLRSLLAAVPDYAPARAMLSETLRGMDRQDEALVEAQRALANEPDNQSALMTLSRIYEAQRNFEKMRMIRARLAGEKGEAAPEIKLLDAAIMYNKANDTTPPDPKLLADAEQIARDVLMEKALNVDAIRLLVSILDARSNSYEEIRKVLDSAKSAVDKARSEASTQPAEFTKADLQRIANILARFDIYTQPNATDEDKFKQTEKLIKEGEDPLTVAMSLYNLYRGRPDRVDDADAQLQEAYRLAPDNPALIEQMFNYAIRQSKWELAEELIPKAVKVGVDPGEGHFLRGRLLLARTDVENYLTKAEQEFRKGLEIFPAHSNGQSMLGHVLRSQNRNEEARRVFLEALRLNPNNGGAAVGLASLAKDMGNTAEYEKYLAVCERLEPNAPWVKQQLAIAEDERDPAQGIVRREKIQEENPNDVQNLVRLADLYVKQADTDKAKATYEKCRKLAPQDLSIAVNYTDFLIKQETPDLPAARKMLEELIQSIGDDQPEKKASAQSILATALAMVAQRGGPDAPKQEEVDAAFLAAADMGGGPAICVDIGNHFDRTARTAKAEEWFRKGIAQAVEKDQPIVQKQAHQLLVRLLLRTVKAETQASVLKEIKEYQKGFDDPFALQALSIYYSTIGRETQALEYMNQLVGRNPEDPSGYYNRANINLRRSQWELAIRDYREAKTRAPKGFRYEHRRRLALALRNAGEKDLAIAELESILRDDKSVDIALQDLYRICMELKRYNHAEKTILPRAQEEPDNPRWPGMLAQIQRERNDADRAIHYALQAAQKSNFHPTTVDILLSIYDHFKRHDALLKFVNQNLPTDYRNRPLVLMWVAVAHAAKKDTAKAMEYYGQALDVVGSNYTNSTSIAVSARQNLGAEAALDFFAKRLQTRPKERGTKFAMSVLLREKGDYQGQIKNLRELLAELPADAPNRRAEQVGLLHALAHALNLSKQYPEVAKTFEQILEIAPDDTMALNNLAYLLMDEMDDPQSAEPYARKAADQAPEDPNVLDSLGWNLVLLDKYDEGLGNLRKAISLNPSIATIHYHVAEALYRRSQANRVEEDLPDAKDECMKAHQMIFDRGTDPNNVLPLIVALGEKLQLNLEKELPSPKAATPAKP